MKVWTLVVTIFLAAAFLAPGAAAALAVVPDGVPARGSAVLAQGADDLDCEDFETQEEAQETLDEDSADPNNLDPNGDGIACALLPSASDLDPAPRGNADVEAEQDAGNGNQSQEERRQARQADRQSNNQDDPQDDVALTCDDFATAEDAQAEFDADPEGLADLDGDGNGIACEELLDAEPAEDDLTRAERRALRDQDEELADAEIVIDEPAPPLVREDIDCIDFTFQEEAQRVYNQDVSDPYNLDPNGDGFACSSLPSSDPLVAQVPRTGTGSDAGSVTLALVLMSLVAGLGAAGMALRRESHRV